MDKRAKTAKARGPDIGLHQAKRLCQLPEKERLIFIAEGLPIILDSAQGFWKASQTEAFLAYPSVRFMRPVVRAFTDFAVPALRAVEGIVSTGGDRSIEEHPQMSAA